MLPNWLYGKSLRKLQEILNSGGQTAEDVSYSNTESGLKATNAQAAIDELTDGLSAKVDIMGIPRQKIYRFAQNSTTTTITVPLEELSAYAIGSLHIRTSSKDSEAHITFALNQGNTSVVDSAIKNYGTVDLSLDSITISGQVLSIVIGGGTAYEWYSAEYFASINQGDGEQPIWNFA